MNKALLSNLLVKSTYIAHTKDCYHNAEVDSYFQSCKDELERNRAVREKILELNSNKQFSLLPYRISVLKGGTMRAVSSIGRCSIPADAQLKGAFTKIEESPYKVTAPYRVHTSLWRVAGSQTYFYGTIGVTGLNGQIDRDNADLIVIHTKDWLKLDVYIFKGLAGTQKQLNCLNDVMSYLNEL